MKRIFAAILIVCLLLSGCANWFDGSYSSVVQHTEPSAQGEESVISVVNYYQLTKALENMVETGTENAALSMEGYDGEAIKAVDSAIKQVCEENPFAVYGVESIRYEVGTRGGEKTVSVRITYLTNRINRKNIQRIQNEQQIKELIYKQLDDCSSGVVFYFEDWENMDYAQLVSDYAVECPQKVMEVPEVTVNLYPEEGKRRIAEVTFTYQNSRGSLRTMQSQVGLVFSSAEKCVSKDAAAEEKLSQLYAFLMERYNEYEIQTSITPAYTLLLHGVGDNKAFANVYAAMCRGAGVECRTVVGTRAGDPWIWNVAQVDGVYYHIDLLRCRDEGGFRLYADVEMEEYVWDYSAFPTQMMLNN